MSLESTNFSLNDDQFVKIKEISKDLENQTLILFWQFTIKTLEELDIVSNENLSIEMFLTRLTHLSSLKLKDNFEEEIKINNSTENKEANISSKMINQIKNVSQEEKSKPEVQTEIKADKNFVIKSFNDLIEICSNKKEIKLKYELEKNVNLVKFEKNRIEISFNESLNKDFVKELSSKLFEWTNERWIITFSKLKGERSIKDQQKNIKEKLIEDSKKSEIYKDVIKNFPDAELINVKSKDKGNDHD